MSCIEVQRCVLVRTDLADDVLPVFDEGEGLSAAVGVLREVKGRRGPPQVQLP